MAAKPVPSRPKGEKPPPILFLVWPSFFIHKLQSGYPFFFVWFLCLFVQSNGHTPRRRSCFLYLVDHTTSSKPTLYGHVGHYVFLSESKPIRHPAPKCHWHTRLRIGDHTDPANSPKTGIQYDRGPTQTWSRPLAVTPRLARQGRCMRQPRLKRCQNVL